MKFFGASKIRLWIFLICCSQGFSGNDSWQRDPRALITNFNNMYGPTVLKVQDEDYPYRLWFFGWAKEHANPGLRGADAIFHARSKDLMDWEIYSGDTEWDTQMRPERWVPVVYPSEAWYDCWHNGDPSVTQRNGRYYMAYTATSEPFKPAPGFPLDMASCIMGATSQDGIHWEKTKQPLLIHPKDCVPPNPDPDRIGDFARPSLHWEDGHWKMWMDYWIPGKGVCLGLAINPGDFEDKEGFQIVHDLREPLLVDWPNPDVVRIGSQYHSFADPGGWPIQEGDSHWMTRQLREAVSPDGLHWKRLNFIPPDLDADACHVPHAFLVEIQEEAWLYLFYATQIGKRRHDGQYHYEYDKIRAMRRRIVF